MNTLARMCCIIFAASLLTVFLSAEECNEDFLQPGSSNFTVYNLQPCTYDIGRLFLLGFVPDASGLALQDYTLPGSAVFKVSGAQSVRVGYYSRYGPYVGRSSADGVYRFCNTASSGKSSAPSYDTSSGSLCFQDGEKLLYLLAKSNGDIIFTELNKDIVPENPQLSNAYINVYYSENGNTFHSVSTEIVRCLYGQELKTESGNVYCEATAQVPKGSRYVKLEINQPYSMASDGSQWITIKPRTSTLIANVCFTGEKLTWGSTNNSSDETPSAAPQVGSNDNGLSNAQDNDVFIQNSGSLNYEAATTEQVIMAEGREYSGKTAAADRSSSPDKSEQQQAAQNGSASIISDTSQVAYTSSNGAYSDKMNNTNNQLLIGAPQDYSKILIVISGIAAILVVTYTINKMASRAKKSRTSSEAPEREEISQSSIVEAKAMAHHAGESANEDNPSEKSLAVSASTPADEDALLAEYWLF